jgi:hypothetical protein
MFSRERPPFYAAHSDTCSGPPRKPRETDKHNTQAEKSKRYQGGYDDASNGDASGVSRCCSLDAHGAPSRRRPRRATGRADKLLHDWGWRVPSDADGRFMPDKLAHLNLFTATIEEFSLVC